MGARWPYGWLGRDAEVINDAGLKLCMKYGCPASLCPYLQGQIPANLATATSRRFSSWCCSLGMERGYHKWLPVNYHLFITNSILNHPYTSLLVGPTFQECGDGVTYTGVRYRKECLDGTRQNFAGRGLARCRQKCSMHSKASLACPTRTEWDTGWPLTWHHSIIWQGTLYPTHPRCYWQEIWLFLVEPITSMMSANYRISASSLFLPTADIVTWTQWETNTTSSPIFFKCLGDTVFSFVNYRALVLKSSCTSWVPLVSAWFQGESLFLCLTECLFPFHANINTSYKQAHYAVGSDHFSENSQGKNSQCDLKAIWIFVVFSTLIIL